jgi:hypothetical protein
MGPGNDIADDMLNMLKLSGSMPGDRSRNDYHPKR